MAFSLIDAKVTRNYFGAKEIKSGQTTGQVSIFATLSTSVKILSNLDFVEINFVLSP